MNILFRGEILHQGASRRRDRPEGVSVGRAPAARDHQGVLPIGESMHIQGRATMRDNHITIHADGACSGNPGPGGWAYEITWPNVLVSGGRIEGDSGGTPATTNNAMELMAAIAALEAIAASPLLQDLGRDEILQEAIAVRLVLDSQYVVGGINEWIAGWKSRGWRKSDGKPVLNKELWQRLDAAAEALRAVDLSVFAVWTKGHADNEGNNRVDEMAVAARDAAAAGLIASRGEAVAAAPISAMAPAAASAAASGSELRPQDLAAALLAAPARASLAELPDPVAVLRAALRVIETSLEATLATPEVAEEDPKVEMAVRYIANAQAHDHYNGAMLARPNADQVGIVAHLFGLDSDALYARIEAAFQGALASIR